jgi:hypothetical protein
VVLQYQSIDNFKETSHTVWIQSRKDPENEWIQLWYCVKEKDIEMVIKDWHDDWRVPTMNQEMSVDKEADAGKEQAPVGDKMMPKKPNPGQNLVQ